MKIRHLASTLLALGWMALPSPVDACVSHPLDADVIAGAEFVFVGTVEGVSHRVATIAVTEVWSGPDLPSRVDLTIGKGEPGIGVDDRTFNIGTLYLFLPFKTADVLTDDNCTLTRPWRDELANLRPATARPPIASPAVALSLPLVIAIGFAAALSVVVFVGHRRARPAQPTG